MPSWKRSTRRSGSTASSSPGHRGVQGPCADARGNRHHRGGRCRKDRGRSRHDPARNRSRRFTFSAALEDIHTHVEARLAELIGPAAGRLHTARSRNDQVATDFKLWVRDAIDGTDAGLRDIEQALAEKALAHAATIMPGFTHLQTAQPVTFGHHLLAYVEMVARDRGRFADARARLNENPLAPPRSPARPSPSTAP